MNCSFAGYCPRCMSSMSCKLKELGIEPPASINRRPASTSGSVKEYNPKHVNDSLHSSEEGPAFFACWFNITACTFCTLTGQMSKYQMSAVVKVYLPDMITGTCHWRLLTLWLFEGFSNVKKCLKRTLSLFVDNTNSQLINYLNQSVISKWSKEKLISISEM